MHSTSPQWVCSGHLVGTFGAPYSPCTFGTDSETDAFSHFEATGHAVDNVDDRPADTLNVPERVLKMAADMQAAHDSGQHTDGLERGTCAACDFGDAG